MADSASQAALDVQQKLPKSISSAVDGLPPGVKAAAGSAIVAARSARKISSTAATTKRRGSRAINKIPRSVKSVDSELPKAN